MTTIYKQHRFTIPPENRTEGMRPLVDTLSKMLFTDYYEEIEADQFDNELSKIKGQEGKENEED